MIQPLHNFQYLLFRSLYMVVRISKTTFIITYSYRKVVLNVNKTGAMNSQQLRTTSTGDPKSDLKLGRLR